MAMLVRCSPLGPALPSGRGEGKCESDYWLRAMMGMEDSGRRDN